MNYATASQRPNPAAAIGALGVPAAFGAILVVGLAVTVTAPKDAEIIDTWFIPEEVEPDTPPETVEPQQASDQRSQSEQLIDPPVQTDFDFDVNVDFGESMPIEIPPGPGIGPIGPVDFGGPVAPTNPMFDPIAASPRGNASRWVTDRDYRSNWIRKGLQGTASFLLTIDTSGKVSDCTITASTGHTELDNATCRLIEKRAKFDTARDSSGQPIAGSYSSSIRWILPE